jgi:hypothetical protein
LLTASLRDDAVIIVAERNGSCDNGAELLAAATYRKKGIQPLDVDAPVLHGFHAVRDLDVLARGGIRISEGVGLDEFHAAARYTISIIY